MGNRTTSPTASAREVTNRTPDALTSTTVTGRGSVPSPTSSLPMLETR